MSDEALNASETIFVNMCSYRDPECVPTLEDLFAKARFPGRIFAGVVQQNAAEDQDVAEATVPPSRIRVLRLDYSQARGPTWARHLCQGLWRGETFVMQIDSHMRFELGWDVSLIEMLRRCPSERPVLSTYPGKYLRREENGTILYAFPERGRLWRLRAKWFNSNEMLEIRAEPAPASDRPSASAFWSGCFNFSPGSVVRDVPYDPHTPFLFFGEEIGMAVRLYTHGYDLFVPCLPVVYHLWDRSYRKTFWELPESAAQQSFSILRIKVLLSMLPPEEVPANTLIELSRYGLGDARTLLQYENYAGVCFRDRRFLRPPYAWQPEPSGGARHTHDGDRPDSSAS